MQTGTQMQCNSVANGIILPVTHEMQKIIRLDKPTFHQRQLEAERNAVTASVRLHGAFNIELRAYLHNCLDHHRCLIRSL